MPAQAGQSTKRERIGDHGVGVRRHRCPPRRSGPFAEPGAGRFELLGQRRARHGAPAVQAHHPGVGAVQVDDVAGYRPWYAGSTFCMTLVATRPAQGGHGTVAALGMVCAMWRQPKMVAGPVTLPELRSR